MATRIRKTTTKPTETVKNPRKRLFMIAVPVVSILFVVGIMVLKGSSNAGTNTSQTSSNKFVTGEYSLNQGYLFSARNSSGAIVEDTLTVVFRNVKKSDEVFVKGQRAAARNDKLFLLIEINIRNDSDKVLYLDMVDLVRLVEGEDYLSPQVSQGLIDVRPQSTKKSNFGFIVPQDVTDFVVQVGEINGEKQLLEITGVKS